MSQYPMVDYERHPAYSQLGARSEVDEAQVRRLAAEIDAAYAELLDATPMPREQLQARFESGIAQRIEVLKALLRKRSDLPDGFAAHTEAALIHTAGFLLDRLEFNHWRRALARRPELEQAGMERLGSMRRDGFFHFGVHRELAGAVWRATEYERAALVKRAGERPWAHSALALHPASQAMRLIRRALHRTGLLSLASAYMGCEVDLLYCALDYAHPAQRWYRDCYADRGLSTTKTVYMHLDADTEMLKAMLYLEDVSERQGPFRFVRGSPTWPRSPFLVAVHKGFDTEDNRVFPMEPDGLDYSLGYYRPRFRLERYRKALLSLPAPLRGSTHFGDDILDDSELSRRLLADEVAFAGPAGSLILFDGSAGIHRGGQVEEGERWAVQIGLRAVRSRRPLVKAAIADLLGHARYRAHLVKRRLLRLTAAA